MKESKMCLYCVEWHKKGGSHSNCNLCHGGMKKVESDGKRRWITGWCPIGTVRIEDEREVEAMD